MNVDSIAQLEMDVAKLQKKLDLAHTLLESANSIVIRCDKDGIINYVNDFGLRFFGYSSEELIGQHIMTIIPKVEKSTGRDLSKLVKDIAKNPDQYTSVPNENITKDGRTVWVTWTNKGIVDKQGNVQEILAIGNDITALKEAEQQRFEYHEKLGAALEHMGDAVFISDNQGNFIHFNEAFATFHRFKDKSECLSRLADYPDILDVSGADGERLPLDQWAVPRALRGERGTNAEYTLQRKDTGETWIGSYTFGPFFDQHGNIAGSVVVARDITEKKRAEEKLTEIQADLKSTFDISPGLICVANVKSGYFTKANPAVMNILGYTEQEFTGKSIFEFIHPDDRQRTIEETSKQLEGCPIANFQNRYRCKDGSYKWLSWGGTKADEDGNVYAVATNITELKQTQESLEKYQRLLKEVESIGKVGGWEVHIDSGKQMWTDEIYHIHEVSRDYQPGVDDGINFYAPESRPIIAEAFQQAVEQGKPYDVELEIITAKGNLRSVHAIGMPDLENRRVYGFFQDITERKQIEIEHGKLMSRQAAILDNLPMMAWLKDREGHFEMVNGPFAKACGHSVTECLGKTDWDVWPAEMAEGFMEDDRKVCRSGRKKQVEELVITPTGETHWHLTYKTPIFDEQGQIIGTAGIAQDITERKLAEESQKKDRAFIDSTLDSITDLFYTFDLKGNFIRWNKTFATVSGYSDQELALMKPQDFFSGDDVQRILESIEKVYKAGSSREEACFVTKDGRQILCEFSGSVLKDGNGNVLGFSGTGRDITERKQAEKEKAEMARKLLQAQKIESIGQLAGGVAHDFNNMLGVILGHAELALMKTDPSVPMVEDLEAIRTAAKRSSDLTRQLLTFARKQTITPKVLDLNETVAAMLKLLQRLIGENVQLSWNPASNVWPVKIDPSQLDQILANLCINARDAINGVGSITIETQNCSFEQGDLTADTEVLPGDYVCLSVTDDGHGIDKKHLPQIFEPFFTTKDFGQGTGLGLATVYGAVKQNDGFIKVASELGQETTFHIYLPRQQISVKAVEEKTAQALRQGTETVLLVEDDQMLLTLTKTMLEKSGYTVLAASDSVQAIAIIKEYTGPIQLLLSDVILPKMNGKDLRDILLDIRPEMKVIFMSGYTDEIITQQDVLKEGTHFLQKPISHQTLTSKVQEVLNLQHQ